MVPFLEKENKVIIYTAPNWHDCHALKDFLSAKGIAFTNKDIAEDKRAREEIITKYGRMATPLLIIGDKVFWGFQQNRAVIENIVDNI